MTDKVVILVTAGSLRECRKIARHLVGARLAACVNITQPIRSIYRWKGRLEDGKEFLLVIKSTRELFAEIRSEISELHSYRTPEIICLPIIDGSPDYLQWVSDSVKKPRPPRAHIASPTQPNPGFRPYRARFTSCRGLDPGPR